MAKLTARAAVALLVLAFARPSVAAQERRANPDAVFTHAVELHQAGDIVGAINAYKTVLAQAPDRIDARSNLGAAYVRLGRYSDAVAEYNRALAGEPSNATVRFNLGLALYKGARIPEAAVELSRVMSAQPENNAAALVLADCEIQMGEHKKVIDLLAPREAALEHDRAFAYLLGTAFIHEGQAERGRALMDRLFRDDSAEGHLLMGMVLFRGKDYPAAAAELSRAAELNPKLPTVHASYARALLGTGENDRAIREFQRELEANPNDFEANLYLGDLRKRDRDYETAERYLTRARTMRPQDPRAAYSLASLHVAMGRNEDACRELESIVQQAPEFVEAHVQLATVYYRLKRKDEGDRERAIIEKLNAKAQPKQP